MGAALSERRSARLLRRIVDDTRRAVPAASMTPSPSAWSDNDIVISWLGHATVLISFYGLRILTDPALFSRVGVSLGVFTAGLKRYVAPALSIKQLPPIDVLLLSHAHMDHMDFATLNRLPGRPALITAKSTTDLLKSRRRPIINELAWGERALAHTPKGDIEITAFQVKHWGRRWPNDMDRGYNGYILRREGRSLVFGGDTALTPHFGEICSKGPFEAAIMPIAAYRPWIANHCTPEEALQMVNAAGAKVIAPVHHKTFKLSEEPLEEPIERLTVALGSEQQRMAWTEVGATFICARS